MEEWGVNSPLNKKWTMDNDLNNLQILTWFENKSKRSLSQEEWNEKKKIIKEYLI